MITEDQLEQLAIQWHGRCRDIEHRTPNIEHRSEEKRSLAEAVRRLNPAIPEEASATHKDSLSVNIKSTGG